MHCAGCACAVGARPRAGRPRRDRRARTSEAAATWLRCDPLWWRGSGSCRRMLLPIETRPPRRSSSTDWFVGRRRPPRGRQRAASRQRRRPSRPVEPLLAWVPPAPVPPGCRHSRPASPRGQERRAPCASCWSPFLLIHSPPGRVERHTRVSPVTRRGSCRDGSSLLMVTNSVEWVEPRPCGRDAAGAD
jgi:hypothetical protein